MADYRVTWEIEVVADDPVDAAEQAWRLVRGPNSMANVFRVIDNEGEPTEVDLQAIGETTREEAMTLARRRTRTSL